MHQEIAIAVIVILVLVFLFFSKEHYLGDRGVSGQTLNGQRFAVLHYTDWCPHCKTMKPIWFETKRRLAGKAIVMGENNEESSPTPGIKSYPTIVMVDEYGHKHMYGGRRNVLELTQFLLAPR